MNTHWEALSLNSVKGLALASSFVTLGGLYSLSTVSIPTINSALVEAPDGTTVAHIDDARRTCLATRMFATTRDRGNLNMKRNAIMAIAGFSFLSYWNYASKDVAEGFSSWKLYAVAATSMFCVFPGTALLLSDLESQLTLAGESANNELQRGSGNDRDLVKLVDSEYATQNMPTLNADTGSREASRRSSDSIHVEEILAQWNQRNAVRRAIVCLSGLVGMYAVLSQ